MYTMEQIAEALAQHEVEEGYDGIEGCLCGWYLYGKPATDPLRYERYDEHVQRKVREMLTGAA